MFWPSLPSGLLHNPMDQIHAHRVLAFVILTLGFGHVISLTKPTSIKIVNNAYTGIVVAIHRDVPEDQNLINIIKVFTFQSIFVIIVVIGIVVLS